MLCENVWVLESIGNMRVSGHRLSIAGMATIFTAVGAIGAASPAEAALYYWQDHDPGYYRPAYPGPQRKPKARRNAVDKKAVAAEKEAAAGAKPQGPLIISISINQQKVRVYDANGFFAEGPVSTGMNGHPTPMGVFSIIEKHKMHHSNIYSGAPMPFMQRITWSGIAMHQGVLPGYPASHGCIRMPAAFAQKMWHWTKMGARVFVTPSEMTPAPFSHPFLVTQKVVPVAQDAPQVDAPLGVKSDKGADAKPEAKPDTKAAEADIRIELRSTVGHALVHTADASGAMPANAAVTMTDASPATASGEAAPAKSEAAATEPVRVEAKPEDAKPETASSEPAATKSAEVPPAADAKPAEIVTGEIKSATTDGKSDVKAEAAASAKAEDKAIEPAAKAEAKVESDKAAPANSETSKAEAPKPDTSTPAAPAEKPVEKAAEPAKATADAPAAKDPSRLPGLEKFEKAEFKREGQIAVFISRKDSKLYVRQGFKPVFDVPVTIAPSDHLLGTHVFTAETDKNDTNLLRWSVVSLPVTARNAAQKGDDDDRPARRRKGAVAAPVETKPAPIPNGPAEALDRISVPPEVMAKIAAALTSGGSIVVSDQGIAQGETGEYTDFIVRLR